MDVSDEQRALREFAAEREWGQFHTPKNLVMALMGEAGELCELFQWLSPEQSVEAMSSRLGAQIRDEVADVAIYLIRLADVLNIDLSAAVSLKIEKNAKRYTLEASRGNSDKL